MTDTKVGAPAPDDDDCPHCGRCRHCGRREEPAYIPVRPVPAPYFPYPYYQPYPWWGTQPPQTLPVWTGGTISNGSTTNWNIL